MDEAAPKAFKRRRTNLAISWINHRREYEMVPQSWIVECLKLSGIAKNVQADNNNVNNNDADDKGNDKDYQNKN